MALEETSEVGKFDDYAARYTAVHAANLKSSGESPEYFARYKIACLKRLGVDTSARILDFGCGIGNLTALLAKEFTNVAAHDPSLESLRLARQRIPSATFFESAEAIPQAAFDVVVLAGVLHHIEPERREALLETAKRALQPGGRVVVFEHNPFNPLTRRSVRDCPFDDDAVLLKPAELRQRLGRAGFEAIRQDYIVFFPALLGWLRPLEPYLRRLPLGAQTLTVGQRAH